MNTSEYAAILLGKAIWTPPTGPGMPKTWTDADMRVAAAGSLSKSAKQDLVVSDNDQLVAMSALIRAALCDEEDEVRHAALDSLNTYLNDETVLPALYASTFDQHAWVREHAFSLLKERSEGMFQLAAQHLCDDSDEDLAAWARGVVESK